MKKGDAICMKNFIIMNDYATLSDFPVKIQPIVLRFAKADIGVHRTFYDPRTLTERPSYIFLPSLEYKSSHPIVAGKEASDGTLALFKAITVYSCLAPRGAELSTYFI